MLERRKVFTIQHTDEHIEKTPPQLGGPIDDKRIVRQKGNRLDASCKIACF